MPVPSSPAGRLAAVALALASAFAALRLYPRELPPAHHPDLLAVVFYSRAMVFAGRVTLLCLAAFAILSPAARIVRREWLLRAGPFEVERAAAISERERDELKVDLAESRARVERLEAGFVVLAREQARFDADLGVISPDEGGRDATH
jgi:hypothetical protein